jgi:hypothetical protein
MKGTTAGFIGKSDNKRETRDALLGAKNAIAMAMRHARTALKSDGNMNDESSIMLLKMTHTNVGNKLTKSGWHFGPESVPVRPQTISDLTL